MIYVTFGWLCLQGDRGGGTIIAMSSPENTIIMPENFTPIQQKFADFVMRSVVFSEEDPTPPGYSEREECTDARDIRIAVYNVDITKNPIQVAPIDYIEVSRRLMIKDPDERLFPVPFHSYAVEVGCDDPFEVGSSVVHYDLHLSPAYGFEVATPGSGTYSIRDETARTYVQALIEMEESGDKLQLV